MMTWRKALSPSVGFVMAVGLALGLFRPRVVLVQAAPLTTNGPAVFINEIHYDNDGTDAGEAIEIAGPAGTDLEGWSLVLYNGNGGAVYNTTSLSGVIPDQQNGYGTLSFSYPVNGIQNGSPDGLALVDNASVVVQFLSYEGIFTATGGPAVGLESVDIGVEEPSDTPAGYSLQLTGTGIVYSDFGWANVAENTFGSVNTDQLFEAPPPPEVLINEVDSDTSGTDTLEFVELYDGGVGSTELNGFVVVFFNGSGDVSYDAFDLDGYSTDPDGYFLLGNVGVSPTPNITFQDNGLQNGADAVAIYEGDGTDFPNGTVAATVGLIDALVYDTDDVDDLGLLVLLNEGQPQINENGSGDKDAHSNQRCPNGSGGTRNTDAFIQTLPSPGTENNCEVPSPPQLVINEILQNPSAVSDEDGEWFEIYNPTDMEIDIDSWTIQDNGEDLHVINNDSPLLIPAGGYLVLGNNPDPSTNGGVTIDYAYSDFFLGDEVDAVVLLDDSLNEIDRVEYDDGVTFPDPDGASMSLKAPDLDNLVGANWCEATTPYGDGDLGTPGRSNICGTPATISEIQYTTDTSGASPYEGQDVFTQGVVTAFYYDSGNRYTFIQDGAGPWSGLLLYKPDGYINVGDLLQVEGTVSEYYGMTEIAYGTATVISSDNPLPVPEILITADVKQEQWESVLVRVKDVTVTNENPDDPDDFGEWSVDDGSGEVRVDDLGNYSYVPSIGDLLDFIQGPLNYSYDDFKIEPRDDGDLGIAPPFESICEIQGSGFASPYAGMMVRTQGVVIADFDQTGKRGFFLQEENCDGDPATSDGIFVYLGGSAQVVSSGDLVEVRGSVQEYYGLTEISTNSGAVRILSEENSLPTLVDLNPPFDNAASDVYFESLEGMYVSMDFANVVGPTDYNDETFVVRSDLSLTRIFQDHTEGTGVILAVDDSGLFEIQPEAKVGDEVNGLLGALDYSFDDYKMQLIAPPMLIPATDPAKHGDVDGDGDIDLDDMWNIRKHWGRKVPPAPASADLDGDGRITYWDILAFLRLYRKLIPAWGEFSVATFNLQNLFDTVNEPDKHDDATSPEDYALQLDKLAEAIHDDLLEPTIIGVQEVENLTVLNDLAARPEIKAEYEAVLVDGPDERGIDVGLLYRVDQVRVLDYEARQGCTTLVDGLGPDGNLDVLNPYNEVTCDSDGDGVLDGNRLFSRPPLVVHLEFGTEYPRRGWIAMDDLYVIVNHFKSKSQDTEEVQHTLPRRIEQAGRVAGLVHEIRVSDWGAKVIVLGDLNDFLDSETLAVLKDGGLMDLLYKTLKLNRYTYTYKGESEVLDHILINQRLQRSFRSLVPVHINADYPVAFEDSPDLSRRSSDHDPVLAKFMLRYWWGW
jgi:predicted extracellular nuclease